MKRRDQGAIAESASHWSEVVLTYKGIADFPAFESDRDDLLPPREPELF